MWKYRRFRTTIGGKSNIKEEYLKTFIVRQPLGKLENLHPRAKKVFNRMIQQPQPLTYKLKEISEKETNSHYEISNPLGGTEYLPFKIQRTHTNNLPVYVDYKSNRSIKETVIRHIEGDVEEFKRELTKVVSNSKVVNKIGKVTVTGLHAEKIKLWLRRLGF